MLAEQGNSARSRELVSPQLFDRRMALDEASSVPIYLQLAEQLKYLISTGELGPGSRLPSARHLARNLSVNRNTVLKAYSVLARRGFVEARRGAGTVVSSDTGSRAESDRAALDPSLVRLIDGLVSEASALNMSSDELGSLVASHARMRTSTQKLKIAFVECNPQSLHHFVPQIEKLGVAVEGVLLDDLATPAGQARLAAADAVTSTFFHLSEVRRVLLAAGFDHELFAVGVRPHVSVLSALERLAHGSRVGVAYFAAPDDAYAPARLRRMSEAIEHTRLPDLHVEPLLLTEVFDPSVFDDLDAVVVRPENIAIIRDAIPPHISVIDFVNELDIASQRFLEEVFNDLRSRKGAESRIRSADRVGTGTELRSFGRELVTEVALNLPATVGSHRRKNE
jgi:DNA-binding transcriptional regulator YhcF (GntR family)